MPNLSVRNDYIYAVSISNPSRLYPVVVDIFDQRDNGNEQQLLSRTIQPRSIETIALSGQSETLTGYYPDDVSTGHGIIRSGAFRIQSSAPVVVTQFNPLGRADGNTTDASLLLPTPTLGLTYWGAMYHVGFGVGSTVIAIATQDGTTVTLQPTADIDNGAGGFPAVSAGQQVEVSLDRYDYVQLNSSQFRADLTGTSIVSSKPVAVFSGHACANVPDIQACDHLEEQLLPVETWGKTFVAARNDPRGDDLMLWRIIGSQDDTTITFEPPAQELGSSSTVNAGEFIEFNDRADLFVDSDKPINVVGFMYGCTSVWDGVTCPGDPYMVNMIPVEQFQNDYVFLVDDSYDRDYVKLIREVGTEITLECLGVVPEDRWADIGSSGYQTAVINMNPGDGNCTTGTNQAWGTRPFGLIVVGTAYAASYAYPGGMALREINIE